MRPKADIEDGYWIKLSEDLTEALARASLTSNEYAICLWVIGHTYGVRVSASGRSVARKFTELNAYKMAQELGRDHGGICRSLATLLSPDRNVLRKNADGELGINTRISQWASGLLRGREWNMDSGDIGTTTDGRQSQTLTGVSGTKKHISRREPLTGVSPTKDLTTDGRQCRPLTGVSGGNISRESSRESIERQHTTGAAVSGQANYRADTPVQKVVCAYKVAKNISWDDRGWDKANYSRASKSAVSILAAFDQDVKSAAEFIVAFGDRMRKGDRSWTIETAKKWAWDEKGDRAGVNQDPGGNQ